MGWIPVEFWHHLVSQNLKTLIFLLFSQDWGGVQNKSMISSLLIYNQFRYHTHKIRLEKLVPLNYRFPTENKKSSNEIDQTVFKLDFGLKSGFPKTRDLSPVAPRGVYISRNYPKTKQKSGNARKHQNRHLLTKWLPFLCLFIVFFLPPTPPCHGEHSKN